MSEFICIRCGSSLPSDKAVTDVCEKCDAAAIAQPEHARQVKVTASDPKEEDRIQALHVPDSLLTSSVEDETMPPIVREYHYSFLKILLYNLVWVAGLILFFVILAKMS
jgi:predicted RNA-binding Zn-ribbon protein involved in translation (DUF1610 family)